MHGTPIEPESYTAICGANPLRGIPTDTPYIGSLLDSISGPIVSVAHSMGGTVITNAAAGKANVKALVNIAAFVPDVGETQGELIGKFPGSEVLPVSVPVPYTKADGTTGTDLYLSKDGQATFAADISTDAFRVLQARQRPLDAESFILPTTTTASPISSGTPPRRSADARDECPGPPPRTLGPSLPSRARAGAQS